MRPNLRSLVAIAGGLAALACADAPTPTTPATRPVGTAALDRDGGVGSFISIDIPNSVMIFPLDVNDNGVIVGRYGLAGHTHGFIRDQSGTISTIDVPGSSFTVAASINADGAIAGWYTMPATPAVRHGFILSGGVFTTVDPPGSQFTNVLGINERGDVSGRFCTTVGCHQVGSGGFHGFVYHDGEFTILDVPGAGETDAFKIAPSGVVGGGFVNLGVSEELFIYHDGNYDTFALPNGHPVTMDNGGINARGDVVGTYCVSATLPCVIATTGVHGFLISQGDLTPIDVPGAVATAAAGINSRGDIVGCYFDPTGAAHGFLRQREPPPGN